MARWSFTDRDMKAIAKYALAKNLIPQLSVGVEKTVHFRPKGGGGKPISVQLKTIYDWLEAEKTANKAGR